MRTAVLLCATIMVHQRDRGDETEWAHEQVDILRYTIKRISTNLGDLANSLTLNIFSPGNAHHSVHDEGSPARPAPLPISP